MDKISIWSSKMDICKKVNEIVDYINATNEAEIKRLQAVIAQLSRETNTLKAWDEPKGKMGWR